MAFMIPACYRGDNDNSERDIFDWFQQDVATQGWYVHHGVQIAKHISQTQGESDFVVIVPGLGVVVLEIKSWTTIRRQGGRWEFGRGETILSTDDPVRQATENRESILDHFEKNGFSRRDLSVTWAIAFPNGHYHAIPDKGIDAFDEKIIDYDDLFHSGVSQEEALRNRIKTILNEFIAKRNEDTRRGRDHFQFRQLSAENASRLSGLIRKDFTVSSVESVLRDQERVDVSRCTEAQNHVLECLEENERILLLGAAGTGKTFVAMDAVKRLRLKNADNPAWRIGLFCYNELLGKKLEKWAHDSDKRRIVAGTFKSYVAKVADDVPEEIRKTQLASEAERPGMFSRILGRMRSLLPSGDGGSDDLQSEQPEAEISDKLAQLFLRKNRETTDAKFDFLVIDEFQDFLTEKNFEIMDRILKGGLTDGNWLICGDFENQSIQSVVGKVLSPLQLRTEKKLAFTICRLKENCRNTPTISKAINDQVSPRTKYVRSLRKVSEFSPKVVPVCVADADQTFMAIRNQMQELLNAGFKLGDITVEFSDRTVCEKVWELASNPSDPVEAGRWQKNGFDRSKARMVSVARFKGLDSPAVILVLDERTDIPRTHFADDSRQSSLLYVGMSRATSHLVILASRKFVDQYHGLRPNEITDSAGHRKNRGRK